MLFEIGLEVSLARIIKMGAVVFLGGSLQVVGTIALVAAVELPGLGTDEIPETFQECGGELPLAKEALARHELVQYEAGREDVGAMVELLQPGLLRAEVGDLAAHGSGNGVRNV